MCLGDACPEHGLQTDAEPQLNVCGSILPGLF